MPNFSFNFFLIFIINANYNNIFRTIYSFPSLYLIFRLSYKKYYNTLISFKFNLLINNKNKFICLIMPNIKI